jgi:HD-like signal output (HDOD) protein
MVSDKLGLRLSDEAYTIGLLHYIGKTLMDRSNPTEYEKVMLLTEKGASDIQAERAVFGCDHIEVGMAATRKWGFPEVLVQGMDYVNQPPADSEFVKLAALVGMCDAIAWMAVEGREWVPGSERDWTLQVLGVSEDDLKKLIEDSTEAIAAAAVFSF